MVKRVKVAVASGRGVAERWQSQYQKPDGRWTRTAFGDSEDIYNKLCDLGPIPDIDKIAEIIGNRGWAHLSCSACADYIIRAADFGCEYTDSQLLLCEACLADGIAALTAGK